MHVLGLYDFFEVFGHCGFCNFCDEVLKVVVHLFHVKLVFIGKRGYDALHVIFEF